MSTTTRTIATFTAWTLIGWLTAAVGALILITVTDGRHEYSFR
jgi:hypothetical protein